MELREKFEIELRKHSIPTIRVELPKDQFGDYKFSQDQEKWNFYQLGAKALQSPKYETVEQWEKRTGESYPDDGPCYRFKLGQWHLDMWIDCIADVAHGVKVIVANHHGKPKE